LRGKNIAAQKRAIASKGFTGYSLPEGKKVHVTKNIRFETKKARNGNDVIIVKGKSNAGNTVTRIIGQRPR